MDNGAVRAAGPGDAEVVAELLHDFNIEFDTPTPGVAVLTTRLRDLLATDHTSALLVGDPAVGVALSTRRTNVGYTGDVQLLDELCVRPDLRDQGLGSALIQRLLADARDSGISAIEINVDEGDVDTQRFYRRHGFLDTEPDSTERAFYFYAELED